MNKGSVSLNLEVVKENAATVNDAPRRNNSFSSHLAWPCSNSEEKETTKCERNKMEQLVGTRVSSLEGQILSRKISLCDCFMRLGRIFRLRRIMCLFCAKFNCIKQTIIRLRRIMRLFCATFRRIKQTHYSSQTKNASALISRIYFDA